MINHLLKVRRANTNLKRQGLISLDGGKIGLELMAETDHIPLAVVEADQEDQIFLQRLAWVTKLAGYTLDFPII